MEITDYSSTTLLLYSLCFVICLSSASRYLSSKRSIVKKLPIAPAEDSSWIWGHELNIFKGEVCEHYLRWAKTCGQVYRFKAALFQRDALLVVDNVAVAHIFQNAYSSLDIKAPAFRPIVKSFIGRGLVWAEDDEHRHQRKLVAPAFTLNAVKGMADDVFECAGKVVQKFQRDIDAQGGSAILNVNEYISPCTLEVVGRVGFGHDFSYDNEDARAIRRSWQHDVVNGRKFPSFLLPILISIFPWIPKLPIPALKNDGTIKAITLRLSSNLLKEHVENPNHLEGKDMFSLLVRESWAKNKKGSGEYLTDSQLLENISTFLMVGHETSSSVVHFTLLDLAKNPDKQAKLREELQKFEGELDYESIQKLPYLDAVAREGLRLNPAAPRTERVATHDDVIPLRNPIKLSNGEVITALPVKAGQVFVLPFTVMNVNPDVWGPDAHEFKPERWLTPDGTPPAENLPHGPWSSLATFCEGPRLCIGWRLGILEVKVILALLIRSFEFHDTDAHIQRFISPSLQPFVNGEAGQLPLKVTVTKH
ncbi:cytochrome P450 [Armillaria fumosa]|nr:cytochrome P450 [Armillaria fumosa]